MVESEPEPKKPSGGEEEGGKDGGKVASGATGFTGSLRMRRKKMKRSGKRKQSAKNDHESNGRVTKKAEGEKRKTRAAAIEW